MLYVNKISSGETVDFAAMELKKYLRMMMPENGDIRIAFAPEAEEGFRLGLMQDFGLDVSDAEDTELDDIVYIDTTEEGGIIAGDNPRALLLAVYEFLRQNGCRWLFPGVDGEFVPLKKVDAVKYRHQPSCRYRGPCIEGACSQEILLETIDFLPKVGMNLFQMQFLVPTAFYKRHYEHEKNASLTPAPVSYNTMLQWKIQCEAEMFKRSIQFHDVGHGWTIEPFGISSDGWAKIADEDLPEDAKKYLALLDGKRAPRWGVALNSQFCMSSAVARKMVVDFIADYSENHSNVDYLHVWLGDGSNNHCECEECVKKHISDWYVMLLNELDEALTAKNLNTRIVFIQYNDTLWAPETEVIKNPKRFTSMIAPIARDYTYTTSEKKGTLQPFVRNNLIRPSALGDYMAYYEEWRKNWKGACLCFEYHFWRHQVADPSGMYLAKRIFEDVEYYKANDVNGLIACGSQRSYFPTGFTYYVFARKQFDIALTFDEILKDYFSCAFGEKWEAFADYLYKTASCFDDKYLEGLESADPEVSAYYNPERAEKLRKTDDIIAEGRKLIEENYNSDVRIRTVSVRLLEEQASYLSLLARAFAFKADGENEKALEAHKELQKHIDAREMALEKYFPHHTASWYIEKMIKA